MRETQAEHCRAAFARLGIAREEGTGVANSVAIPSARRLRRGIGTRPSGQIVRQLKFQKLQPNKVGAFLIELDNKCAAKGEKSEPVYGLRQWQESSTPGIGSLLPIERVSGKEPVLLVIHGTFSNSDHLLSEISTSELGKKFLHGAAKKYRGGILTFDHQTLRVRPFSVVTFPGFLAIR